MWPFELHCHFEFRYIDLIIKHVVKVEGIVDILIRIVANMHSNDFSSLNDWSTREFRLAVASVSDDAVLGFFDRQFTLFIYEF